MASNTFTMLLLLGLAIALAAIGSALTPLSPLYCTDDSCDDSIGLNTTLFITTCNITGGEYSRYNGTTFLCGTPSGGNGTTESINYGDGTSPVTATATLNHQAATLITDDDWNATFTFGTAYTAEPTCVYFIEGGAFSLGDGTESNTTTFHIGALAETGTKVLINCYGP